MNKKIEISLPVDGKVLPLTEVNDYLFNKKIMGEGVAIIPSGNFVFSPVSGEVVLVYDAKHAIAVKTEEGLQLLIHVGIGSVKLEGRGFATYVNVGDKVNQGDKLLFFDKDFLEKKASSITPIVITNSDTIEAMETNYKANKAGDTLITITLK